ncbi:MAG: iron-sulfur cluster assembly accessory protein [Alphaproteobacteria bacterium]|nr:iron-sulfur cluster assembly accessory protein [Alphaproteobacteria bacterium]
MTQQMITLTSSAAEQVKALIAQAPEGQPVLGLRIGVQSGGCSGMSYFMEYAVDKNPMEEVVEDKGVKIFVDPKAMLYLIGTEMDYNDGEFESGFTFRNPNETGRCGCGKSFKV